MGSPPAEAPASHSVRVQRSAGSKESEGFPTKKQTAWIDAYQSAGVVAYVVRPSDLDFIIRLLEEDKETWELAKAA